MRPDAGKTFFVRARGAPYLTLEQALADPGSALRHPAYVWLPPDQWAMPDFHDRRVAIVANSAIRGLGRTVDSFDVVIRLNRMSEWRHSADDDGRRVTCWAGLPEAITLPDPVDPPRSDYAVPCCFPQIAALVDPMWAVSPFHLSARFIRFVFAQGLQDRLVVSGGAAYFHDRLRSLLPDDVFERLYTLRIRHSMPLSQFAFDILLTGVRTTLLVALSRPRSIGLFGFNFFSDGGRQPWPGHDLDFDRWLLAATIEFAKRNGTEMRAFACTLDAASVV
jgi:hypothetical protein